MKIRDNQLYLGPQSLKDIFTEILPEDEVKNKVSKKTRREARENGILITPRNQEELKKVLQQEDLENKILALPQDSVITGRENNVVAKHIANPYLVKDHFLRLDKKSVVKRAIEKANKRGWLKGEVKGLTFSLIEDLQLYPSTLTRAALEEHKGIPWGIAFRGSDGTYRVITFSRAFEGAQLLAAHDKDLVEIEDSSNLDPFYTDSLSKRVKSQKDPTQIYGPSLSRLAISTNKRDNSSNWRRTLGICTCTDFVYSSLLHKGSSGSFIDLFCKHLVMLHHYALRIANQKENTSLTVNLFPFPSEDFSKTLDILQHRTYFVNSNGEPAIVNKATINNALGLAMESEDLRFWTRKGEKKPLDYILPES